MNKRGRKVGANGAKSRELLLHIAAEEFAQNGYHDTKISTIVKTANVTQPTFYLYFKNKEAIFKELVDNFKEKLSTLTRDSRLSNNMDPQLAQARIKENLTSVFRLLEHNKHVARIGFILSDDAYEIKEKMSKQIEQNLTVEVQHGYFHSNIDLSTVAFSLIGAIERLTITKLWTDKKNSEELAEEVTELFLYGLSKNARS
ncbi:TetR family transcriptional regulator [Sporosarcina sp. P13]|uniref:TetR/AcrR family transcriptional regulator n=1 Tax=Sporosarcina sp. P13 TaxID=2048263 RepID=UPI000C162F7F|nr:TetR/AcrR family transcriptional regulator [Sporosarcina sp. P13]PIC64851.1 TetR family transcriptional regulator [Sporosarcina sp. P13]